MGYRTRKFFHIHFLIKSGINGAMNNSLACYQLFNFFKADPKKHCKTYMVESL